MTDNSDAPIDDAEPVLYETAQSARDRPPRSLAIVPVCFGVLGFCFIALASWNLCSVWNASFERTATPSIAALPSSHSNESRRSDISFARLDISANMVDIIGRHGTQEWRSIYAAALDEKMNTQDFVDRCTFNGFLKDSNSPETFPCVVGGEIRAVRFPDTGRISYFHEEAGQGTTALDPLQRDPNSTEYLNMGAFWKAVGDHAYAVSSAKERAEFDKAIAGIHVIPPEQLAQFRKGANEQPMIVQPLAVSPPQPSSPDVAPTP